MQFSKIEAIKNRRSVRTFTTEALSQEHVAEIKQYLHHIYYEMGPFGNRVEFFYSRVSNNITTKGEKIGTYGVVKNASAFIIAACKDSREHLIDLGYLFEKLIIFMQHLNIGSCWLGGTFKRNLFYEKFDVHTSKLIPAISPIGYAKPGQRLIESAMRKMAQSDTRLPWEMLFFQNDFDTPLSHEAAGVYDMVFEMVRRGPSASNKQPWRLVFDRDKNCVHFYLAHTPNYGNKLNFDMQYLDIGIAMYHFEASVTELGHDLKWVLNEVPTIKVPDEQCEFIATACLSSY
ncbi:MAG: hypothetical protein PWP51_407 [Clostridiales bacterium]|jgi:nitroreductase|nr:hypothetical protein [Clostridiales bacterium]MDN5297854.1 hypothetical protein [Clostridiales bacterium]